MRHNQKRLNEGGRRNKLTIKNQIKLFIIAFKVKVYVQVRLQRKQLSLIDINTNIYRLNLKQINKNVKYFFTLLKITKKYILVVNYKSCVLNWCIAAKIYKHANKNEIENI